MKKIASFAFMGTSISCAFAAPQPSDPAYYVHSYVENTGMQYECRIRPPGATGPEDCRFAPRPGGSLKLVPVDAPQAMAGSPGASSPAGTPAASSAAGGAPAGAPAEKKLAAGQGGASKEGQDAFAQITGFLDSDLSIPASPAFATLGIKPENIQRPNTIRALAGSLARGLGTDGKMVNGVAIDISPASLFFRSVIVGGTDYMPVPPPGTAAPDKWKYYHDDLSLSNYWKRLLARTTVSLATTPTDSNGASRAAFGLRVGLLDFGDPGLYADVVNTCVLKIPGPVIDPGTNNVDEPQKDTPGTSIEKCDVRSNGNYGLWAAPSLYLGLGKSWYSDNARLLNGSSDTKALWIGGSWGPGSWHPDGLAPRRDMRLLLQLYAGRRLNDRAQDPNNAAQLISQSSTEGTFRVRLGQPTWHGFFDIGRSRVRLGDSTKESLRHVALGVEFKLGFLEDSWLQLASVRESGFTDGKSRNGATVNFKVGAPFLQSPGPSK